MTHSQRWKNPSLPDSLQIERDGEIFFPPHALRSLVIQWLVRKALELRMRKPSAMKYICRLLCCRIVYTFYRHDVCFV